MNLGALVKSFRLRINDVAKPQRWSDPEIIGYFNEAEKEACARARLIYDDTSDLTQITLAADTATYDLDPRIIRVDLARLSDARHPLRYRPRWWLDKFWPGWRTRSERPCAYFDVPGSITLVGTPVEAGTLALGVYRLPLEDMADIGDEPEIIAAWHERLIDWPLFRAYSKRDSDSYDPDKATQCEGDFIASFGVRRNANVSRKQGERRQHRTVFNRDWGL